MNDNRYKILVTLTVAFFLIVIAINRFIYSSVKEKKVPYSSKKMITPKPSELVKTTSKVPSKHAVTSQDPHKYGIVAQKEFQLSPSQAEWDNNLKVTLGTRKILNSLSHQNAFEGLAKTAGEYERQQQKINERIKVYEGLAHKNPNDEDVNQKLQALYMLKSTLAVLKDKVVTKPK